MPPAAHFDFAPAIEEPYDSTEDVGGIEVEAFLDELYVVMKIHMLPLHQLASPLEESKDSEDREDGSRCRSFYGRTEDKSLVDSYDSDEIPENSNEARLLQSIAKKSTVLTYNLHGGLSFDEDTERYLDVLDKHLEETDPESTTFDDLDNAPDDLHPKKTRPTLDQVMETLLDNACCECDDLSVGPPLRPAIRPSKWTHGAKGTSSYRKRPNHVQFKEVNIREFKMTLGNHPSATSGPPVMLDWAETHSQSSMNLEDYEKSRPPRRTRRQLKLSLQQRHNILVKERGFSFEEVKGAWQAALEIRKQRKETLDRGLALMKWDEVWESTRRKFSRIVDG
jgi:hypothetical protein